LTRRRSLKNFTSSGLSSSLLREKPRSSIAASSRRAVGKRFLALMEQLNPLSDQRSQPSLSRRDPPCARIRTDSAIATPLKCKVPVQELNPDPFYSSEFERNTSLQLPRLNAELPPKLDRGAAALTFLRHGLGRTTSPQYASIYSPPSSSVLFFLSSLLRCGLWQAKERVRPKNCIRSPIFISVRLDTYVRVFFFLIPQDRFPLPL